MPSPACKITVLGSGTSVGIPTIGCHCDVCTSSDPRDNRLRPSVLLSYEGRNVLIDTTPDFRTQALRARIERLDAVDRKSTRLNSSHLGISYDVFCLKKKTRVLTNDNQHNLASQVTAGHIATSDI